MNVKECVMQGKIPENFRILDAHAHLGDGEQGAAYVHALPIEESLRLSKKIGINAIIASSLKSLYGSAEAGNERMMELTRIYSGYVYASIFYDPHYHGACMKQLDRYCGDSGFAGVKIHPRDTRTPITTDSYNELYEYCIERGIIVACHTWDTEAANRPADFERVLKKYPELRLQLCHMGGTYQGCMDSIRLANEYPYVYLDINGSLYSEIWLEKLVEKAPFDRFVFGTDQTFNDPRIMIGRVLLSDLSDEQKQSLMCDNFERALGRRIVQRG